MNAEQLFESKYLSLYQPLYRFLYQLTGSQPEAEDLLQEVFALAWQKRETLLTHPNPDGWLYTTARRLWTNAYRVEMNRRRLGKSDDEVTEESAVSETTEDTVMNRFFRFEELSALLSREEIELLIQRFDQGRELKEIAEASAVSEGSVRTRLYRIIKKLREHPELMLLSWMIVLMGGLM